MMQILQAIVLGIVQGASEFLPISSSGHLYIIPKVLGWGGVLNSVSFDVSLHVGTTIAVIVFFWKDWLRLVTAFLKNAPKGWSALWKDNDARLFLFLVIGSIPAGIVGIAFKDFFTNDARNLPLVAFTLIFFGILLYFGDKMGSKQKDLTKMNLGDTISIGLAQCLALVPGVSRSGITMTSGLFRGMKRESAAKFTFLLSTPTILGATLLEKKDIIAGFKDSASRGVFLAGLVAAAVSGFLAIKILLKFVQTNNFNIFVIYRILLGLAVLAIALGI